LSFKLDGYDTVLFVQKLADESFYISGSSKKKKNLNFNVGLSKVLQHLKHSNTSKDVAFYEHDSEKGIFSKHDLKLIDKFLGGCNFDTKIVNLEDSYLSVGTLDRFFPTQYFEGASDDDPDLNWYKQADMTSDSD